MKTVLDCFVQTIRAAASFNSEVQEKPHCILWPDKERQWESAIPKLQATLPELLALGSYDASKRTGPAIWLRCAIARVLPDLAFTGVPIIYLPGVGKQDLRAIEQCPAQLKPLAELQYRGVIWTQQNAKDWTLLSFLVSNTVSGLGVDVAGDAETKAALQISLNRLLDADTEILRGKRLDKDFFNQLVTSGDPVRDILDWLSNPETFKASQAENIWKAFVSNCKSHFKFDPSSASPIDAAKQLAQHTGPWEVVWKRFCESPQTYSGVPDYIRKCKVPEDMFSTVAITGAYPQWNESEEELLRKELHNLQNMPARDAQKRLLELEKRHGERRLLPWAKLGESNLALALQHIACIAQVATETNALNCQEDFAQAHHTRGFFADDAMLRCLTFAQNSTEAEAINAALHAVYFPWVEDLARALQATVANNGYTPSAHLSPRFSASSSGVCIIFVDGLRFDLGMRLLSSLEKKGLTVSGIPTWTALPSVTATGKAAVSPIADRVTGGLSNADFEPEVAATGQSLKGGYHFKKLLDEAGWTLLSGNDCGDGKGKAWCEFGDIDSEGHNKGCKLAKALDDFLSEIVDKIESLLAAGWKTITVVTDHGWLLLPDGLPKVSLEKALVESRWGRCAALKEGASTSEPIVPWHWNSSQSFVLASGVSCFHEGEEYAHGGLSVQECLTLQLELRASSEAELGSTSFAHHKWKGLRCAVTVDGDTVGILVDIRKFSGDENSSIVVKKVPIREDGTASVIVENEDLEGTDVALVLLSAEGKIVAQLATIVGGGK
jgi:hypothetical protein